MSCIISVKCYTTCQEDDYCKKEIIEMTMNKVSHSQNQITLKDGLGKMRMRKKAAI